MELPEFLPAQLYLLAYDPGKQRVRTGGQFSRLIRASVLSELLLRGHIADESGKVRLVGGLPGDPVLAGVLTQISESQPKSWAHWIRKDHRATAKAVRDELEA